ncbi:MAG: sensor histidine kinase [Betaproteobacteria bacterium]
MTMSRKTRTGLLAAAACLLLAILAFLYVKSSASEHRSDAQALALLRELDQVNQRWDADAIRLSNTLTTVVPALPDRRPIVTRIFNEMEHGPAGDALARDLPSLQAGMEEKRAAYQTLQQRHVRSLQTLDAFRERLAMLATDVSSARAREPVIAPRAAIVLAHVERMRAALNVTDIEAHAEMAHLLEPSLASITTAASAAHPVLRNAALRANAAGEEFLSARESEANAWRRFSLITIGSRVQVLARHVDETVQLDLDEKERWRVYLATYAGALLVGILYLLARLLSARKALQHANRELENRVEARTRDLSNALQQLKESEAQLVQSEKMSSLGQLVAGVAHEVNTPLAYVKNSLSSVRERIPELKGTLDQAQRLLETMRGEAPSAQAIGESMEALSARLGDLTRHDVMGELMELTGDGLHGIGQMSDLVTNLRNFARLDRSKVASFDVNEGVRTTLLIARPALRGIEVQTQLGELPAITGSPSQVNQVLLNLLTNAAQAMDKAQGRIRLSTRREGRDSIAIEVKDNGRGIAAAALPRIFDPFFTTKDVGKGTGLGLSIAYKIVAQHGGRIDVRSEFGVGSTFTVTLPVRPPEEKATALALQGVA